MPIILGILIIVLLVLVAALKGVALAGLIKLAVGLVLLLILLATLGKQILDYGLRLLHVAKLLKALARIRAGIAPQPIGGGPSDLAGLLAGMDEFFKEWCKQRLGKSDAESLVNQLEAILAYYESIKQHVADNQDEATQRALEDFIAELRRILEELKAQLAEQKEIQDGIDLLGGGAPADEQERDRVFRRSRELAERYRRLGRLKKLLSLEEKAAEWRDKYSGRPTQIDGASISTERQCPEGGIVGVFSSVIFGNGGGVQLEPNCCLVVRFSPKIDDEWGDDLAIDAGVAPSISVSGLPQGRDLADPNATWDPISPAGSGKYEFPGLFRSYRYLRICNTGRSTVTIRKIGRP